MNFTTNDNVRKTFIITHTRDKMVFLIYKDILEIKKKLTVQQKNKTKKKKMPEKKNPNGP